MKILRLTLKKKWFDMILSGEKKEEYREIKPYWVNRLDNVEALGEIFIRWFDAVEFRNGYQKDAPMIRIECKGITKGKAKPEWSDNWQGDVFKISLGEILDTRNCL